MEKGQEHESNENENTIALITTINKNLLEESDEEDDEDSDDCRNESFLPAISPVSSSSGFISCESKPTTPTPTPPNSNELTDKSCDECECAIALGNKNVNSEKISDEIIITSDNDNESGEFEINKERDYDEYKCDKNCKFPSSSSMAISIASTSSKIRSKRLSSSQQQQHHTTRYRQSKKHISLDDEIVIYESDSSLMESRRRISNQNHFTLFNHMTSLHQSHQGRSSVTAICRHKSEENSSTQPSNQIVSILKRKDSSGKDSPSLVTFSPNVKDVERVGSSAHRQGILKKRSSLDESSRRYRSHSPSSASSEEKGSCLVKNDRRRNSCEEIHHHGILKQKSYESTGYSSSGTYGSSGVNTPNSGVQGILKKPSLTPSDHSNDHTTKHVSISEAVILAAAELCKDMIIDDSAHDSMPYIKPILKLDSNDHFNEVRPKPILKKNHSSENEEIRSILKSRKSSREEQEDL